MKKNTLIILVSIISYLPLLINAQTILLNETFELSTWALQYPSISYHNNCGSASGYAVYFQTQSGERWIKTYQLNVSEGGSIDFYFFMPLQLRRTWHTCARSCLPPWRRPRFFTCLRFAVFADTSGK